MNNPLADIVCENLDRKLIFLKYMPPGQRVRSATADIKKAFENIITNKESYKIAEIFYSFWNERFPSIDNLMTFVNEVGWFTSY